MGCPPDFLPALWPARPLHRLTGSVRWHAAESTPVMALTSPTSKRRDSDPSAAITVKAVTPLWLHVGPAEKCGLWPMPPLRSCAAAGCCPKLYLFPLSGFVHISLDHGHVPILRCSRGGSPCGSRYDAQL